MGPVSEAQAVQTAAPETEIGGTLTSSAEPVVSPPALSGKPERSTWVAVNASARNLRISDWLFRSRTASLLWLGVRLWLGYQWLNAGYQKIWGSEHAGFWSGGTGVKGFATAGVAGSSAGHGGASYGWWAAFLHNFVIPNSAAIGKLVAGGEFVIGVLLIIGLFTGVAAFAGIFLNMTYMLSGSAGVNPMYALLGVLLVLAWRNAGWIGLDRLDLQNAWTQHHFGSRFGRVLHRRAAAPAI